MRQVESLVHIAHGGLQTLSLLVIAGIAAAALGWTMAALLGLAPWLDLAAGLSGAGAVAAQVGGTALLVAMCVFVPSHWRVMRLEQSHRRFAVSMRDVARAYASVHAADRTGIFEFKSEFDSVRDRIVHLRDHPDLGALEPEILELAAQMGHESRDLAERYADDKVARAKVFLQERQHEARLFAERIQAAHGTVHEVRRWLDAVELDEASAQSQLRRLQEDLADILPRLGLDGALRPQDRIAPVSTRLAAE